MSGKKWVILVAGTKEWDNYRDQANVCCAYQQIKKSGIPDDQIVVMMYDDIANNPKNPCKGTIVSVIDDSNVYLSVPKDYTGVNVTPEKFLAALRGDSSAGAKIIRSEGQDNIFIYMSGLGEGGAFKFPDSKLFITALKDTIDTMTTNRQFSQMVIYVESTNSSTMFNAFSDTTNVYAVTSGDSSPSYWDPERKVYRSDEFSAAFLKGISQDITKKTFENLNSVIKSSASNPTVEFGNTIMNGSLLSKFLAK